MIDFSDIIATINERIPDNTQQEIDAADVREPLISLIEALQTALNNVYTKEETDSRYDKIDYLTITSGAYQNKITMEADEGAPEISLEYSKNDGEWEEFIVGQTEITLNGDEYARFRGVNSTLCTVSGSTTYANKFTITDNAYVSGDVTSLLNGKGGDVRITETGALSLLFINCPIITPPNLPSTTLSNRCYFGMFYGCTNLTQAPKLPATTTYAYSYCYMFYGCTSLTTAPELPATVLANDCYNGMFYGCTSLTTAPELPATTLADYCYNNMFQGCINLLVAPVLPATTLATGCYENMFSTCVNLEQAPELPATTLAQRCYKSMFQGCIKLNSTQKSLPATSLPAYCYNSMFYECASLVTAPIIAATNVGDAACGYMFYKCINLNYIKCLDLSYSSQNYQNWVDGVKRDGTFVKNANGTNWETSVSGIPRLWRNFNTNTAVTDILPESYVENATQVLTVDRNGNWTKS